MVDGELMGKMRKMGWILDQLFDLVFQQLLVRSVNDVYSACCAQSRQLVKSGRGIIACQCPLVDGSDVPRRDIHS